MTTPAEPMKWLQAWLQVRARDMKSRQRPDESERFTAAADALEALAAENERLRDDNEWLRGACESVRRDVQRKMFLSEETYRSVLAALEPLTPPATPTTERTNDARN